MISYKYLDGNGNEYVITNLPETSIEYKPVKPLQSSSGIYDGGDYIKRNISKHQYNEIAAMFSEIIKKGDIYINDRVKRSGMIILQEESRKVIYILEPDSKEIKTIENKLHNVIQS